MLSKGRRKRAMRWYGYLGSSLAATAEGYRALLDGIDAGVLDDVDRRIAISEARGASSMLLDLGVELDSMIDVLPPALTPVRAMEILQAVIASSLALLAVGPEHELILNASEFDDMMGEPFTQHWLRLLVDAPEDKADLTEVRPVRAVRDADVAEIDELRGAIRLMVPKLLGQYPRLHARLPLADEADIEEALDLAIELAIVLRRAQSDGRGLRSYPADLVYAQMIVLAAGMQSLVVMVQPPEHGEPPLAPETLAELAGGAGMPALLA